MHELRHLSPYHVITVTPLCKESRDRLRRVVLLCRTSIAEARVGILRKQELDVIIHLTLSCMQHQELIDEYISHLKSGPIYADGLQRLDR